MKLEKFFQCRLFFFGWKIFPLQWTFFFDTRLRRQMVIWCGRFIFCQKYTKRLLQQSTNFLQTNSNVIKIIILISNIIIILSLPTICLYKPMQNHHRHHNDTFCFPSCGDCSLKHSWPHLVCKYLPKLISECMCALSKTNHFHHLHYIEVVTVQI